MVRKLRPSQLEYLQLKTKLSQGIERCRCLEGTYTLTVSRDAKANTYRERSRRGGKTDSAHQDNDVDVCLWSLFP